MCLPPNVPSKRVIDLAWTITRPRARRQRTDCISINGCYRSIRHSPKLAPLRCERAAARRSHANRQATEPIDRSEDLVPHRSAAGVTGVTDDDELRVGPRLRELP